MSLVTLNDIAMLAGVSRQAVSSVLSGRGSSRVSALTRAKIVRLAQQLNYVPNPVAMSLSGHSTRSVGILLNVLWSPLVNCLCGEVSELLLAHGYQPLLGIESNSGQSAPRVVSDLLARGIDGMILLSQCDQSAMSALQRVPFVYCSHHHRELQFDIGVDTELTGYLPTQHLLSHGHKRVVYLEIMPNASPARIAGWRRAQAECGIDVSGEDQINLRSLGGRADELLAWLRRRGVTALFCSNDYVAAKTACALQGLGVRIPDDLALMGCDGYSFTEFYPGGISTVIQPVHILAEQSVEMLLTRIAGQQLSVPRADIRVSPVLHLGASCGCPARSLEKLYQINTHPLLERDYLINFNQNVLE